MLCIVSDVVLQGGGPGGARGAGQQQQQQPQQQRQQQPQQQPPEHRFAAQLAQMEAMGLVDRPANIRGKKQSKLACPTFKDHPCTPQKCISHCILPVFKRLPEVTDDRVVRTDMKCTVMIWRS